MPAHVIRQEAGEAATLTLKLIPLESFFVLTKIVAVFPTATFPLASAIKEFLQ